MVFMSRESRTEWETFGAADFETIFSYVCGLQHVQDFAKENPELNLLPHDHEIVFRRFKAVLRDFFWGKEFSHLLMYVFQDEMFAPVKELEDGQLLEITPDDDKF